MDEHVQAPKTRGRKKRIQILERSIQSSAVLDERYQRRLQHPFGEPSRPVELVEPGWMCRWMDSSITNDRIYRGQQGGWDQVRVVELKDRSQVGGFTETPDGHVARGVRQSELLMKIPLHVYTLIRNAKERENMRTLANPNAMKNEITEAAGQRFGDEAAEFLHRQTRPVGSVTDQYERIERTDPTE